MFSAVLNFKKVAIKVLINKGVNFLQDNEIDTDTCISQTDYEAKTKPAGARRRIAARRNS